MAVSHVRLRGRGALFTGKVGDEIGTSLFMMMSEERWYTNGGGN